MSFPFMSIQCTSCSFQGISLVTFGDFGWEYQGQVFRINTQMGLCENCNAIVAMERFPTIDTLERAREMHADFAGKRLGIFERDEAKKIASKEGLAVLERVMKLNRLPVCLRCGGNNVRPVRVPRGVTAKRQIPVCLGISHPWCGGLLMIEGSRGMRIGMNLVTKTYDTYGQLIITARK